MVASIILCHHGDIPISPDLVLVLLQSGPVGGDPLCGGSLSFLSVYRTYVRFRILARIHPSVKKCFDGIIEKVLKNGQIRGARKEQGVIPALCFLVCVE